jgi:isoquinoline 1-oxidoreductase beta subunit
MRRRTALAAGATAVLLPGCTLPVIPRRPAPSLEDAAGWVRHEAGRYTVRLPRAEMGQQVATAFQQIACDELGAAWDAVTIDFTDTSAMARVKGTVGSDSVREFALPLARACATLRLALARGHSGRLLAAEELPAAQLRAFSGQGVWVGRASPLVQALDIVTGRPLFAADVRLPGMVYGRVLRAPGSPELASRPRRWDATAARAVPGFLDLVQDDRLAHTGQAQALAILAATPGALDRIESALRVEWERLEAPAARTPQEQLALDAHLATGALQHVPRGGRPAADTAWTVDLRLEVPLAAHACIEPRAAVARWRDDGMEVWAGHQDPFYVRDVIARRLGLREQQVTVRATRVGGAFGGKTLCTVELEAALLARHLGRPVKVQWTRAQEFAHGFHRPPSSHRVRARVEGGRLVAWWHAFSTSHILLPGAALPAWMQGGVAGVIGDAGAARGSEPPYRCPSVRVEYQLTRLEALTGPWRGLGAGPNLLAMESAIDECARSAGVDPLAFRLGHVDDARLAGVIRRAAAFAGWDRPALTAPDRLRGRGFACGIYKQAAYAAAVAEVEIDAADGAVRVTSLWCAHDCGLVINPDQVRAQVEGNLVWCIGMVLVEALPFEAGAVQARNFAESPIPRYRDVGRLRVDLVESRAPPGGAGETAMVAGAAAITNAIRDATGWRPARMPVRHNDILAALRARSHARTR